MVKSELNLEVRYYETDQMGVVHHSNYVRYFECGRNDFLSKIGIPIHKIEEAGIMTPVVSVECRYRYPAKLGDTLRIVTTMNEVPKARIVVNTEVFNQDGQLLCDGAVVLGFINSESRKPVRCPEWLRDIFEKHINE